jgi:hypothetical protein
MNVTLVLKNHLIVEFSLRRGKSNKTAWTGSGLITESDIRTSLRSVQKA